MTLESGGIQEIEKKRQLAIQGRGGQALALITDDIPALIESLRARDELLEECKHALEEIERMAARPVVAERARQVLARFAEKETPQ